MARVGRLARFAVLAAALTGAAWKTAGAQTWMATLTGPNEFPSNTSPGTGSATMTLTGDLFTISVSFSGLVPTTAAGGPSGTTASHIHCCVSPTATPPTAGVATQVPTFVGFPLGVNSGTYSMTFDVSQASFYNPAFITANGGLTSARVALFDAMNSGRAYLNIHSNAFPGGEIRGFLVVTPEPSTMLLVASGLGALGGLARRRRSAA